MIECLLLMNVVVCSLCEDAAEWSQHVFLSFLVAYQVRI